MKNVKTLCFFFFVFLISSNLKGATIVDFEELSALHTRVITYSVSMQNLLSYDEIDPTKPWAMKVGPYNIVYSVGYQVTISLDPAAAYPSLLVRSKGTITAPGGYTYGYNSVPGGGFRYASALPFAFSVWSSQQIISRDPETIIKEFLPPPPSKVPGGSLPINRFYHSDRVETLATLDNNDKGLLGEQVTMLTFLAFGYVQHPSKYEGIHGLDGIFESFSGEYLFLTQSKQKGKSQSAKHELNEPKIAETLTLMEKYEYTRATAARVRDFLNSPFLNPPQGILNPPPPSARVYKFAHRVADAGKIQHYIAPLDLDQFPKGSIKLIGALQGQKVLDIQKTLATYEDVPEKQLELVMIAMAGRGFSLQNIIDMFKKVNPKEGKASY